MTRIASPCRDREPSRLCQYVERGRLISTRLKEREKLFILGGTCGSHMHYYRHLTEQI
jgi:hypothetical protein